MLEKLAKHHVLWLQMLINLGCDSNLAKDIVQDMYLRLYDLVKDESRIMYRDGVNRYYVYITLRNMYFSRLKKMNKNPEFNLLDTDVIDDDLYDEDENIAFDLLNAKIKNITKDWTVYDKRLFEIYFMQGISLRKISKETGIGLSSIHNSIQNYREIVRAELSEDLQDYFNKDYHKIK